MGKFDITTDKGVDELRRALELQRTAALRVNGKDNLTLLGSRHQGFVVDIIREAISIDQNLRGAMHERQGQTLQQYVAIAVISTLRDKFSWMTACDIVAVADVLGLTENDLHILDTDAFGIAKEILSNRPPSEKGGGVKRSIIVLARSILWFEAYSFLVKNGYDWNEAQT